MTGFGEHRNFTPQEYDIIVALTHLCRSVTVSVVFPLELEELEHRDLAELLATATTAETGAGQVILGLRERLAGDTATVIEAFSLPCLKRLERVISITAVISASNHTTFLASCQSQPS